MAYVKSDIAATVSEALLNFCSPKSPMWHKNDASLNGLSGEKGGTFAPKSVNELHQPWGHKHTVSVCEAVKVKVHHSFHPSHIH